MVEKKKILQIAITEAVLKAWKKIVISEKIKDYDIDHGSVFEKIVNNYKGGGK